MFKRLLGILSILAVVSSTPAATAAEVVLYSSNPSELLDLVSKGFEVKTGIKVSIVRLGTGEAMKRIAAEKDKPLCDVFWSGDVAVLENAKENFQPYRSPEAKVLPAGYVEKEARWTASNAHVMIIMVNKSQVKEPEMPKLWKDLKPGTRIVSNAHDMGDWKPEKQIKADGANIYLWRITAALKK